MPQHDDSHILRVDSRLIKVDPGHLNPSPRDAHVVVSDLAEYFSRVGYVPCGLLEVIVVDDDLYAVRGLPFLQAAQLAQPPVDEIVCILRDSCEDVQRLGLTKTTTSDIVGGDEIIDRREIIFFAVQVSDLQRKQITQQITSFFHRVTTSPEFFGGDYKDLRQLCWENDGLRLSWKWKRSQSGLRHLHEFYRVLWAINDHVAMIQSWNGLSLELFRVPSSGNE